MVNGATAGGSVEDETPPSKDAQINQHWCFFESFLILNKCIDIFLQQQSILSKLQLLNMNLIIKQQAENVNIKN